MQEVWESRQTKPSYTSAVFYGLDFSEIVFVACVLILKAASLILNGLPIMV